jgi:signal peptidase I, bacterial type
MLKTSNTENNISNNSDIKETNNEANVNTIPIKLNDQPKHKKDNMLKELISWVSLMIVAAAISILINSFIMANSLIPTGSMENTIMTNDRVMGFRLAYLFNKPKRGDIVIFPFPDDENTLYVKRIIGLPGETIHIIDGKVYINNAITPIDEPYLKEDMRGRFGPFVVPDEHYFMMGDNRNSSLDSRFWNNTYVHEDKLIAKVIFRYFPNFTILN